jgi:hypothetical protein
MSTVSTIHIDLYDATQDDETLFSKITELVYGSGYEALVHQHTHSCEESDHCCGPGSVYWATRKETT